MERKAARLEFAKSMGALMAMKRTVELTKQQLDVWFSVLSGFPIEVVNAAVLEVSLSADRFTEVGDLYQICRRSLQKVYAPNGTGEKEGRPGRKEIEDVAARLGLKVK